MRRLILLGVIASAGCGGSRSDEGTRVTAADTAGGRTLEAPGDSVRLEDTLSTPPPSDAQGDRGQAADTAGGRTLEAPGDSVRLEDTLSTPPPSDSAR